MTNGAHADPAQEALGILFRLFLVFCVAFATLVVVSRWRFPGPKRARKDAWLWAGTNTRSIRTEMSKTEILRRISASISKRQPIPLEPFDDSMSKRPIYPYVFPVGGEASQTSFRLEYRYGRSEYVVRGRVLEGPKDQLVVFRLERRWWRWWVLLLPCLAGITATKSVTGPWRVHHPVEQDPLYFICILAFTIGTGILLPILGLVPKPFADTVVDALAVEFKGEAA